MHAFWNSFQLTYPCVYFLHLVTRFGAVKFPVLFLLEQFDKLFPVPSSVRLAPP